MFNWANTNLEERAYANRLTESQCAKVEMLGMPVFGSGRGSAWVSRWCSTDPTNSSVMIFLMHNMVELHQLAKGIGIAGFGAIMRFHALASASLG